MKRRICESCYFYEAAGIVNSGWCRHPDRQFGTGVRLVVRGNELNCRNGWDIDLWVPADIESGTEDDSGGNWGATDQLDDHLTSIVPARYERPELLPEVHAETEDVVVRHAPYPEYTPPEKEARDLVTNPRAAILKAREQFKVRQLREGRIADRVDRPILVDDAEEGDDASLTGHPSGQHGGSDDHRPGNAPFLGGGAASAPRAPEFTVPPVTRDEIRRPYVSITYFPEDDRRFESLPDEFVNSPPYEDDLPVAAIPVEPDDNLLPEDEIFDDWIDDELVAENGRPVHPPKRRRISFVDRLLAERRNRRQATIDDWEFSNTEFKSYREDERFWDSEPFVPDDPEMQDHETSRPTQEYEFLAEPAPEPARQAMAQPDSNGSRHSSRGASAHDLAWATETYDEPQFVYRGIPAEQYLTGVEERYSALQEDRRPVVPEASRDELPRWNGAAGRAPEHHQTVPLERSVRPVSPELPQICRTCRDFRPAESGDRGWCNNAWAFRHRRMVDADVLSCEASFGNWWISHDSVWQKSADVSRHAQETPLLDRLLGITEYSETPPHRSGSGR